MILGRSFALPACRFCFKQVIKQFFQSTNAMLSSRSLHIVKRQPSHCQATTNIFSSDCLYIVKRQPADFSVSPGTPLVAIIKVALHYFTENSPRIHSETVDNYAVVKLGPGFN